MAILSSHQRKILEDACVKGRRASEQAVRAALTSLAVNVERPPAHLGEDDRQLRRWLRAKARQLGDEGDNLDLLVAECAYEQWHRLLFARFLSENSLLIHPDFLAPVTLSDCEELADSLGEPDGWSVAARFAAEILPGIFRLDDPCVRLRLAPEGRQLLEDIVAGLPSEVFASNDALGWVYQFWQKDRKDEVNASERKISGADLGPVTQLFTEHYMVRFLLENTLGAWWAARYPKSPLVEQFEYLAHDGNGNPAAGSFEEWPRRVADVTVMDPCCGSGHFLVEAFTLLWQMRGEEEALGPIEAQDAVLRDNLFGLELDPRCVQIAMFAVALRAWTSGGGWRELPIPKIACSGIAAQGELDGWLGAPGANNLFRAPLERLHKVFASADDYGSLLDPRRVAEYEEGQSGPGLWEAEWPDIVEVLEKQRAETADPAAVVLGDSIAAIARSATLLSSRYVLCATNVPYRSRVTLAGNILSYIDRYHGDAGGDLATAFVDRCVRMSTTSALVCPQSWLFQPWYVGFRHRLLTSTHWRVLARLGAGAFGQISGEVVNVALFIADSNRPAPSSEFVYLDMQELRGPSAKADGLRSGTGELFSQLGMLKNPDARVARPAGENHALLAERADSSQGICTGDYARFGRQFWELPAISDGWERQQSTVTATQPYGGRDWILRWDNGVGELLDFVRERLGPGREGSWIRGLDLLGRRGVVISQSGDLKATLYEGNLLDNNAAAIVPADEADLPALWAYCSSDEYRTAVRNIDSALKVTNRTLVKVPFDVERWRLVAEEAGPLPEPTSLDPTQWLFDGHPANSTAPLQVAVARLLGYQWPAHPKSDGLEHFADADGIVCLPSVGGEPPAVSRLQQVLAAAYGQSWSPARQGELLEATGSSKKNLGDWLRDDFFKQHCALFGYRPFVWHVWDGLKDGFSALVNYHRLDRKTFNKLTYTYVGDWIERQRAELRDKVTGAETRLAAATKLQKSLELILAGEPPYDIYVRWKSLAEQPLGWEPDLNDGVRLNIRPLVESGVLRASFNINWKKDRGKNPDGSERINDCHFTTAEKRAARGDSA